MVRLRPYKPSDAERIVSWIADERMFYQWSADRFDHYPLTAADLNAYYDAFADADWFYPMSAFDEQGLCGHLIMRFTDEGKHTLRLGFIIVDDARRGRGLGRAIVARALAMAFDVLGADVVTLVAFENNPAAYRCYLGCGFLDVTDAGQVERYLLMGEDWACRTLSIDRAAYGA